MKEIVQLFFFGMIAACSCRSQSVEDNIVLVNTGSYDKGRIAKEIAMISRFSPKVISVDVAFPNYHGDNDDKALVNALGRCKKLIMPSEIHYEGEDYYGRSIISVALSSTMEFFPESAETGFVSAEVGENQTIIPNYFMVWQEGYTGDVYKHFSIVTAMAFDSLQTIKFIQNNERFVNVDYKNGRRKFKVFSGQEILSGKITRKDIAGKVVMMGFLGPGNEDKFYSPLNANDNDPDMYGLEYLANIVAQVLDY